MPDTEKNIIHKHHNSIFKNWHLVALLIPSIVFVFILSSFSKPPKETESIASANTPPPILEVKIQIGSETLIMEKAENDYDRKVGLSKYNAIEENRGMIFLFPKDNVRPPFWMKDMIFPLDIAWVNDGVIVQIDSNLQPEVDVKDDSELNLYLPNQPIDYLLAVNANFFENKNIIVGSSVRINEF